MDLYCPTCGEPWDFDTLHAVTLQELMNKAGDVDPQLVEIHIIEDGKCYESGIALVEVMPWFPKSAAVIIDLKRGAIT